MNTSKRPQTYGESADNFIKAVESIAENISSKCSCESGYTPTPCNCSCHSPVSEPNWKDYPETDIRVEDTQKEWSRDITDTEVGQEIKKMLDDSTPPLENDWAEKLGDEWDETRLSYRIIASETFAINHGFDEWEGTCVKDWWIDKLRHQKELSFKEGARIERERIIKDIQQAIPSHDAVQKLLDNL